jgi:hypothetical protein
MQNLAATPCGSDLIIDSSSSLCSKPERANHHVLRRRLWANFPGWKPINRIQRWLQAMRLRIPLAKWKHRRRGSLIRSRHPAWEWHVWNDVKNKLVSCKNKLTSRSSLSCLTRNGKLVAKPKGSSSEIGSIRLASAGI